MAWSLLSGIVNRSQSRQVFLYTTFSTWCALSSPRRLRVFVRTKAQIFSPQSHSSSTEWSNSINFFGRLSKVTSPWAWQGWVWNKGQAAACTWSKISTCSFKCLLAELEMVLDEVSTAALSSVLEFSALNEEWREERGVFWLSASFNCSSVLLSRFPLIRPRSYLQAVRVRVSQGRLIGGTWF